MECSSWQEDWDWTFWFPSSLSFFVFKENRLPGDWRKHQNHNSILSCCLTMLRRWYRERNPNVCFPLNQQLTEQLGLRFELFEKWLRCVNHADYGWRRHEGFSDLGRQHDTCWRSHSPVRIISELPSTPLHVKMCIFGHAVANRSAYYICIQTCDIRQLQSWWLSSGVESHSRSGFPAEKAGPWTCFRGMYVLELSNEITTNLVYVAYVRRLL